MAKKVKKSRWSFADERHLIQLAASSKSLEAIAVDMNRAPEAIAKKAIRLALSLKSDAGPKVKK